LELKNKGLKVDVQRKIKVYYKGNEVGEYYADLIVEDLIILELKAANCIIVEFENQILNFGTKPEFKRKIFENTRKLRI
jgi:GxxExxY protein